MSLLFSDILADIRPIGDSWEERSPRSNHLYYRTNENNLMPVKADRCTLLDPAEHIRGFDTAAHFCLSCAVQSFKNIKGEGFSLQKYISVNNRREKFPTPLTCCCCGCRMEEHTVLAQQSWVLFFKREEA